MDVFKLRADTVSQRITSVPGKFFSASCKPLHRVLILIGKQGNDDMKWSLKLLGDLAKKQLK